MNCNQCKGPTSINHAGGKEFHYCRQCKIEVAHPALQLKELYNDMAPIASIDPRMVPSPWSPTWVNRINPKDTNVPHYGRSRTDQHGSIDIQYSEDGQTWGYKHSWMPAQDQCYICGMTSIDTLAEPLYKNICKSTVKSQGIQSPIAIQMQDRLEYLNELVRDGYITQEQAKEILGIL